tara:strand:+ start:15566 stop:18544 length:2979 start_codon:yes stop_codon:yes gene_type:complete
MFDVKKASTIITNSDDPVLDAVGSEFGIPQCLLDFSKGLLAALPSSALGAFKDSLNAGKGAASSLYNNTLGKINVLGNIFQYDDETGKFSFVSQPSKAGVEEDSKSILDNLSFIGAALGFGAQAWALGSALSDQYNQAAACVDKYKALKALQNGPSQLAHQFVDFTVYDPLTGLPISNYHIPPPANEGANHDYIDLNENLAIAAGFIDKVDSQLLNINEILAARQDDPLNNPEPIFNGCLELPDGRQLFELDNTLNVLDCLQFDEFGNPIFPAMHTEIISSEDDRIGPPEAKEGQYIFSKTGLYYDAYSGGLEYEGCITNIVSAVYFDDQGKPIPGTGVPEKALEFLLEYNPNIGGKGEAVSWSTFNVWANTVFNLDTINESPNIQPWYSADTFLQVLTDQRNREVYDLSSIIQDYAFSGLGEDSALVINQRQVLFSRISTNDSKINRRKKQIEVHYTLNPDAVLGAIPINNLEGLDNGLIAVQKALQEQLMFKPNEVSGIVLPLCPSFVKSEVPQDTFIVGDLIVPTIGAGGILNVDQDLADGTSGTVLSLNDQITMEDLVVIYNFLDADLVSPDSEVYESLNQATLNATEMPAQMVASSTPSLFPSGIGLPFFRGMCNFFSGVSGDGNTKASYYTDNDQYLFSPYRPYGYSRIQSGWNDVDSLLYSNTGATIETWLHVPDLNDADGPGWNASNELSALHRVVMGCENRGGSVSSSSEDWVMGPQFGSDAVRGLLMGFSRDRRLTQGAAPSNSNVDNELDDGLVFYMAPTQSINTSGVTFLAASADVQFCPQDTVAGSGYYGIFVDTSTIVNSAKIGDVSSAFCLVSVTVDYGADLVSVYLDGNLMKSQNVAQTFGRAGPPNIPSMVDTSSYSYSNIYEDTFRDKAPTFPPNQLGYEDFWHFDGPKFASINNGPPLTPWILGGGYTDGMFPIHPVLGSNEGMNFMGGKWGGKKSGLNGFMGSFKLYKKALTQVQIAKNYGSQRGFFKNIKT